MLFDSPQRMLTRISKLNVDQLPIQTGIPTLDRFLAQAISVEPFKFMDYRDDREACLKTFTCLREVLDAPDLPLVWIVNDVILPWSSSTVRSKDPRQQTIHNLRALLRFRGQDAPLGKVDPKWLPAVIGAIKPEQRSLWALHILLKDSWTSDLPLPVRVALAKRIDGILTKDGRLYEWISISLEPLERLTGRDPTLNPVLSDLFTARVGFPSEVEELLDGMSDWTRISVIQIRDAAKNQPIIAARQKDADLLSASERAKLFLDYYRLVARFNSDYWRSVNRFSNWDFPLYPSTICNGLFTDKFLKTQGRRKLEFTPSSAKEILRFETSHRANFLHMAPFVKRIAAQLEPEESLAQLVDGLRIPTKNKTELLSALRQADNENDTDPAAGLQDHRTRLINYLFDVPNLWFPLQASSVVPGPWGQKGLTDLTGQLAPYWFPRGVYFPGKGQKLDLWRYMDTVARFAVQGIVVDEFVQELHQVYQDACTRLARLKSGEGKSLSPRIVATQQSGKVLTVLNMSHRLPMAVDYRDPLPTSVPRDAMIAQEESVLAEMKHCLDRIDRLVTPDLHAIWERTNMPGNGSKPSAKWLEAARNGLDPAALAARLHGIDPVHARIPYAYDDAPPDSYWVEQQHQRATVWAAQLCDPDFVGAPLTDLALRCYVTVPDVGIKAEKLGNATLTSLEALPDGAGAPFLARILSRVRYPKIRKKINASLDAAAAAAGITRGELDELTVPDHGMASGTALIPLGFGSAEIMLEGPKAKIAWFDEQGKGRKSPTKAMKDADPDGIKAAKALIKEIAKDVATQVQRLERLYLQDRAWDFQDWCDRYLNHGTMAPLCRNLIWITERDEIILPQADGGEDINGQPVDLTNARIRLWHPIMSDTETVEQWRDKLMRDEVTQPFRQVWRETYGLSTEDKQLVTYSNRFAGHIVRQHQMMTLAHLNGWTCTHRIWVDAPNDEPSHILLPEHNLYAEFWTVGAGGDDPPVLDSGAYIYLTTDRLRFNHLAPEAKYSRGDEVALSDVPPIVVSEVMRHCDLFTSVPSIAMDANWLDRGKEAEHPNQWQRQANAYWLSSFEADLSPTSAMRRAMLERLFEAGSLPSSYVLQGSYLHVQTTKDTYRIHIGTAGVQRLSDLEAVDVLGDARKNGLKNLPFVGEQTLGLILSKAEQLRKSDATA